MTAFNSTSSGALSFTGKLLKKAARNLAGSASFTGSFKKTSVKAQTAGLSFSGTLQKTGQPVRQTAALSFTGSLNASKRKFGRPALTSPITVTMPSTGYLYLSTSQDYIVDVSLGVQNPNGLTIIGGQNVIVQGPGTIDVGAGVNGVRRGAYFKNVCPTGTLYLDTVTFTSTTGGTLTEGIDISSPGATVTLVNTVIAIGVSGTVETNHGALLQCWAGPNVLQIDGFVGSTAYQGFRLQPQELSAASVGTWSFNNVTLTGLTGSNYLLYRDSNAWTLNTAATSVSGSSVANGGLWPAPSSWSSVTVGAPGVLTGFGGGLGGADSGGEGATSATSGGTGPNTDQGHRLLANSFYQMKAATYSASHVLQSSVSSTDLQDLMQTVPVADAGSHTPTVNVPNTGGYLLMDFGESISLTGWYPLLSTLTGVSTWNLDYSLDDPTTLPASRTWVTADSFTPSATARTDYVNKRVFTPLSGVTAVRFKRTDTSGTTVSLTYAHLYGVSDYTPLQFWDPLLDQHASSASTIIAQVNPSSSVDLTLRLHNASYYPITGAKLSLPVDPEYSHAGAYSLQNLVFLSTDGVNWSTTPPTVDLGPGESSTQVFVRLVFPSDFTGSNRELYLQLTDGVTNSSIDTAAIRIVSSTPGAATPSVWFLTPPDSLQAGSSLTLFGGGLGPTQATYTSIVQTQQGPDAAPVAQTVTSWTDVAAGANAYTSTREISALATAANLPAHQEVVLTPVGVDGAFTLRVVASTTIPSSMAGSSLYTAPVTRSGWRVQVKDMANNLVASSVPYVSFAFTNEMNGIGGGSISLNLSEDFFKKNPTDTWTALGQLSPNDMIDKVYVFEFYEDSQLRGAVVMDKCTDNQISPGQQARTVTLSGSGVGIALDWALTLPPNYPTLKPLYWTTDQARLYQWLRIFGVSKTRFTASSLLGQFTTSFTRAVDSQASPWVDSLLIQQPNGVTLRRLLEDHCAILKCDYVIRPNRVIDVFKPRLKITGGVITELPRHDVSSRVTFSLPSVTQLSRDVNRDDQRNYIYAQDSYGYISIARDDDQIVKSGRREGYVDVGTANTTQYRRDKATGELNLKGKPVSSWTVKVLPYDVDLSGNEVRRVFTDYNLGDYVGVELVYEDDTPARVKVLLQVQAISVAVDQTGVYTLELTLETLSSVLRRKIENAANSSSGGGQGGGGGGGNDFGVAFNEQIWSLDAAQTTFALEYLPIDFSENITLGMKKYMHVNSGSGTSVREFTRKLRRGVHWTRKAWTVTIIDPSVFDEGPT